MTEFKLPELGENIEQGDLVRLMIAPGADVKEGQPVMELETDKAVIEVPSSVSGVVSEIRVKEGDKLKVGQVIFTVENGAGGAKTVPAETKVSSGKTPATQKESDGRSADVPARRDVEDIRFNLRPGGSAGRTKSSRNPQRNIGSLRIHTSRTRREHRSGRPRPPDDHSGRERLRGPAGDGT